MPTPSIECTGVRVMAFRLFGSTVALKSYQRNVDFFCHLATGSHACKSGTDKNLAWQMYDNYFGDV